METIHESIIKWANKYVPKFNELSKRYKTPYYTQSPLDLINQQADLMIIGINPKGNSGIGSRELSVEQYIKGNPCWGNRFDSNGKNIWKYNHGVRFFLGYDDFYNLDGLDNDEKVIWTNLSPFESKQGNNDLKKELMEEGLNSTLDLINILKPKYIILLGVNAFYQIKKAKEGNESIEYSSVFNNVKSQIGRINNIPSVCVPHPSGQWEVSNKFIPIFILLHRLAEVTNKKNVVKPLKEVVEMMRTEMGIWQERVVIKGENNE